MNQKSLSVELPFLKRGNSLCFVDQYKQGFETVEKLPYGFSLLAKKLDIKAKNPVFNNSVKSGECPEKNGLVAYYTNRCPYSEYNVNTELTKTAEKRGIPLKIIKLKTMKQAQSAPTPATIFSLFYNGNFLTTDIGSCLDSRFEKLFKK